MFDVNFLKSVVSYSPDTGKFIRVSGKNSGKETGTHNSKSYGLISITYLGETKQYYAHRLAWFYMTGKWPKEVIDHINGVPSDNRWINLREATNSQNLRNCLRKKINKSGYKGISKNRDGFQVRISLGTFKTLEEAITVYKEAMIRYHGEFAKFPE